MSQCFPETHKTFNGDIKVQVDLSNYATKADIKNISHIDIPSFALKTNLANLKTEVDKLDIDKLKPLPDDVSKLSNVVTNEVVKKTEFNDKITEIENKISDTSNLTEKTPLATVENKIPNISNLATKTQLTTVENKIPDISNLTTKTALTTAENKIPNINGLATKMELTTVENKILDISGLATKTDLTNLSNTMSDISTLVTKSDCNTKITKVENNIKKLQTFDLSCFMGKNYFDEDSTQSYLVLQPIFRYFKINGLSKRLSAEGIKPTSTSDNSLKPTPSYYLASRIRVKFTESCLKQDKITFNHGKVVNI